MNTSERMQYFIDLEDELLLGGVAFSEWCTFILKSVYDAFIGGADLATIITVTACIETYFITENSNDKGKNLAKLIEEADFLSDKEKVSLHKLRKYRNSWVHVDRIDDSDLLINEQRYDKEVEEMSILSIRLLHIVLFSNPFV